MKDRDCQLPADREVERVALAVREPFTQSARAAGTAKRLEDVEKVVRDLRLEVSELYEWISECLDFHADRIEALEDTDGITVVRKPYEGPSDYS